jgi:hypothetical protein
MNLQLPFASKELPNGKKLYRRKHGYLVTLAANGNTEKLIEVPYVSAKINEAEIVWAPEGVSVDMMVIDNALGTFSGTPNATLDQFGFDVAIEVNHFKDISQYDADVYQSMVIKFVLKNPTATTKTVGINMVFHEVK